MAKDPDITALRRREIFEAATRVISRKGFHSATIREIAAEAGLGKGTIYQYIRKKEDLITLIAEEGIPMMTEKIAGSFSPEDSPREKLKKIIDMKLNMIQDHASLSKTMATEIGRIELEDSAYIEDIYENLFLNKIIKDIEGLIPESRLSGDDAIVVADVIMHLCFLWSHSELIRKHAGDIENYKRILTDLFLYGLKPDVSEDA